MKKFTLFYSLFLVGILSFAQAPNTVRIGILADRLSDSPEALMVQLQKEINTVVGQDATIIFSEILENNFNMSSAKSNYQKLIQNETDIIIAFGVVNNIMLYREEEFPKPVIGFGSINTDFMDIPKNQKTSETNNLTYLIWSSSYTDDLETFYSLYPYKKVGIIVDNFTLNVLPIKDFFDNYFSKKEFSYELIILQPDGSIDSQFNDVDAIYLSGGYHMNDSNFNVLVNKINAKKLPSFSGFQIRDVERGILASNKPETSINQFFRRIALDVEAIIAGTNPSELPTYIDLEEKLTINYKTARQIDYSIRYSMLAVVDLIGGENEIKSDSTLSIKDVMGAVVAKNLALSAERENINLTEQDVKTAKSDYLPNLDASVQAVYLDEKTAEIAQGRFPEYTSDGSLTLDQLIYSPLASGNIAIQKEFKKAQVASYNASELDALLNASISYFNTLILKKNAVIQNQNLQVTKKNLEIAENNYEGGVSGKADVLRFKSQLAQNKQSLIEAINSLRQAYFTINQLMNIPISTKIDIDDAILAKGLFKVYKYEKFMDLLDNPKIRPTLIEFLVEEAKINAPELKNIGYNLEATKRNYRMNNNSRFIPTVAFQGQYNLSFLRDGKGDTYPPGTPDVPDSDYNFGLNVSLPIFQKNQRNINRQTALIQQDQLIIQQENIELSITKNIHDILLNLISQISNIETSQIAEETAKESLELTQNSYEQGAVPIIQLIDAQSNHLQAQLSSATANYNYLITSMQLERAIGYFFLMNTDQSNQEFIERSRQYINNKN